MGFVSRMTAHMNDTNVVPGNGVCRNCMDITAFVTLRKLELYIEDRRFGAPDEVKIFLLKKHASCM